VAPNKVFGPLLVKEIEEFEGRRQIDFSQEMEDEVCMAK
jgi:hypothetical protein